MHELSQIQIPIAADSGEVSSDDEYSLESHREELNKLH
jgi:hypothetical protein